MRFKKILLYVQVPLAVFLLFLALEIFIRSPFFWDAPFRNSLNSSHESEKILEAGNGAYLADVWVFGSSWAEYGVDQSVLEKKIGKTVYNFAVISSQTFEQMSFYRYLVRRFNHTPKVAVLIVDYTHLPIRANNPVLHVAVEHQDIFLAEGFSSLWLKSFISSLWWSYRYRQDLEIFVRGKLSPEDTNYRPFKGRIREAHVEGWLRDKKWMHPELTDSMSMLFNEKEVDEYLKIMSKYFRGTKVVLVESPITPEPQTNFGNVMAQRSESFPDVIFIDKRTGPTFEREKHFYDKDHLNPAGAKIFSDWLGDKIREKI